MQAPRRLVEQAPEEGAREADPRACIGKKAQGEDEPPEGEAVVERMRKLSPCHRVGSAKKIAEQVGKRFVQIDLTGGTDIVRRPRVRSWPVDAPLGFDDG